MMQKQVEIREAMNRVLTAAGKKVGKLWLVQIGVASNANRIIIVGEEGESDFGSSFD